MKRSFGAVACIMVLLGGCATKWSDAPEAVYTGPHFDTRVMWVPAGEKAFDISASPKSVLTMCCNIPGDDIRIALIAGARQKEADLCGAGKPAVDSDAYDAKYYLYSARVVCR